MVVGILQIVIAAFIVLQSAAVGIGHAIENSNDAGGSAGMITAILFLVSGIVYLSTKKSKKMGGDIACLVINLLAWLFAITNAHDYTDLMIWGWLAFIIGVGFFSWHLVVNKKQK
ncbi:Putative lipoprotein [Lactobacillus gigeriorum DSM 23908 = CRBIP 24.85]|uniref:Lipoprotein n=1 Tax=Lactobacillus gigeriorum DSM 23908 = CRBIP 24.85 TaxID=1423751 RepID=I7LDI2_9LACO|nr:hypothetical protein [Lactobacillus gigeriorum]KRN14903.1 lipoprotein [Lactobacillus gigeriorum DSM 23908 = CRBIP 24.85]CCI87366.1 Putative lipoprotein [Lactobacillus gigeriorum DSM 23908 = CRBIP 24.85]